MIKAATRPTTTPASKPIWSLGSVRTITSPMTKPTTAPITPKIIATRGHHSLVGPRNEEPCSSEWFQPKVDAVTAAPSKAPISDPMNPLRTLRIVPRVANSQHDAYGQFFRFHADVVLTAV